MNRQSCSDNFLSTPFNKRYQALYSNLAQNSKIDNLTNTGINWTMSSPIYGYSYRPFIKEDYIDPEMIVKEMKAAGIYYGNNRIAIFR